jgi:hypothetical protein
MRPPNVRMANQNTRRTSHYITDTFDNRVLAPDMGLPEPDIWITLYNSSGTILSEYEVSLAGLTAALVDAVATNIVEIPICTITGDAEVPSGVKLRGTSRLSSVIIGTVTVNDLSIIENLTINLTGSGAGAVVGVLGPDIGYNITIPANLALAKLYSVSVSVENNAGPAYAVQLTCGSLTAYDTELLALTGTDGYAAFVTFGEFTHYSGRAVGTIPLLPYYEDI